MSGVTPKKRQWYCCSGKKKRHSAKGQVVIDSNERIICTAISMSNMHDFKLFQKSRLPIQKETTACVDSGYAGMDKLHANTDIPKKSKHHPLTKSEKLANKAKASVRIAVEHINAKIKTFKILAERYRNLRKRFGLRFNLICSGTDYLGTQHA